MKSRCLHCGNDFERYRPSHLCCSRRCADKVYSKAHKEQRRNYNRTYYLAHKKPLVPRLGTQPYHDPDFLMDQYFGQGKTLVEIGRSCGVGGNTILWNMQRLGIPRRSWIEAHPVPPGWKGGKTIAKGYVLIRKVSHPCADAQGYVPEHRLVMESILGRYLAKSEVVHHINENRADNRRENLMLFESAGRHRAYHRKHPSKKGD